MASNAATRRLKDLLATREIVMAPGAADALTARLVEAAGFPAVYMTGFGATAARLGAPDLGLMTQTEMTTHARDMARATARRSSRSVPARRSKATSARRTAASAST